MLYTITYGFISESGHIFCHYTVVVCVVGAGVVWALAYILRILRNVRDISETIDKETKQFAGDLDTLREQVRKHSFIRGLVKRLAGRQARHTRHHSHT